MKAVVGILVVLYLLFACSRTDGTSSVSGDNPEVVLAIPAGFPAMNRSVETNKPTKYGVELGEKLFNEKKLSADNTVSCASCHKPSNAFADGNVRAIGIYGREGLRNVPPIQNMAFMRFYNWDGHILQLEKQPLVPIITREEMGSSILEVIGKLKKAGEYNAWFERAFGDEDITSDRIYRSLAQYAYTLISADSKYDKVRRDESEFTARESRGYAVFRAKCATCHATQLFTDQSFRNVGFPLNPNADEAGRGRVTGAPADYMAFRVPSLRNIGYTAPYGSFGQFRTLRAVLDYFDRGVLAGDNLDPVLKSNGNRIPLTEQEKEDLLAFMDTLNDSTFVR